MHSSGPVRPLQKTPFVPHQYSMPLSLGQATLLCYGFSLATIACGIFFCLAKSAEECVALGPGFNQWLRRTDKQLSCLSDSFERLTLRLCTLHWLPSVFMRIKLQLSAVVTGWIMKSLTGTFLSLFHIHVLLWVFSSAFQWNHWFWSLVSEYASSWRKHDIGHSIMTWLILMS